jgi:hypothetical protein
MRVISALAFLLFTVSLSNAAVVPPANQTDLVEFYNQSLDHYFVTTNAKEISDLDTGFHVGWARTGYRFPVVKIGAVQPATTPTCRFYGRPEAKIDSHFYSSKLAECEDVKLKFPNEWQFEAEEVFRAFAVDPNTGQCPVDTSPVYRLWNQRPDVNHRYTNQLSVYLEMVAKGYKPEGDGNPQLPVAFCQPTGGAVVPPPPAGSPACTLSSPTLTPALNTTQTLTATCTGTPTSYVWAGCTSTTNTCTTTRSTAGAAVYSVTATNALGTGTPVTRTLTWGGTSGPLPQCTISAPTLTPTTGGTLLLSASCNQSPTRYDWLGCSYEFVGICNVIPTCSNTSTTCSVTQANAGFARYAVAAANTNGTGAPSSPSLEVEWRGSGGGGGGGSAPSCTASATDSNPPLGTNVTLSAYCFNNPVSYAWTGVGLSSTVGIQTQANYNVTGPQTYTVVATNSAGSGQAFVTVNWGGIVGPPVPSCTLSASNTSPTVGQSVTLTSNCTNSPTTYTWVNCASAGPTCVATATAPGATVYTVRGANGSGPGNVAAVQVNWQAVPTAAPVCTVASSIASPFTGQQITLTATCSNTPASGSYVWTNCSSTQSTCNTTSTVAGTVTYTVTAANILGTSPPVSVPVTWQQGVGGQDFCGSYPNVIRLTAPTFGTYYPPIYTQSNGGFAANGVVVVAFTVPPSPSFYSTQGLTDIAEFNGPPVARQMNLSASACDFRPASPSGMSGPFVERNGSTAGIQWNVGAAPVALTPGQTYYFNFRNWSVDRQAISCETSTCNAVIQVNWPQ